MRATNKNNNFSTVLENIKELIKIKKERKSNLTIGVGFVVTQENYKEVLEFAELFKEIEVDYCQYKPEIIQIERNTSSTIPRDLTILTLSNSSMNGFPFFKVH